ncbi:MAG TPA: hypothetical protein PKD37_01310 [Oligoflexia bacterium]|nr:hypothetical protein [Oligoflexia bacterium]HMP26614.1 hypothetical protein [Oligoflexia bacterium]
MLYKKFKASAKTTSQTAFFLVFLGLLLPILLFFLAIMFSVGYLVNANIVMAKSSDLLARTALSVFLEEIKKHRDFENAKSSANNLARLAFEDQNLTFDSLRLLDEAVLKLDYGRVYRGGDVIAANCPELSNMPNDLRPDLCFARFDDRAHLINAVRVTISAEIGAKFPFLKILTKRLFAATHSSIATLTPIALGVLIDTSGSIVESEYMTQRLRERDMYYSGALSPIQAIELIENLNLPYQQLFAPSWLTMADNNLPIKGVFLDPFYLYQLNTLFPGRGLMESAIQSRAPLPTLFAYNLDSYFRYSDVTAVKLNDVSIDQINARCFAGINRQAYSNYYEFLEILHLCLQQFPVGEELTVVQKNSLLNTFETRYNQACQLINSTGKCYTIVDRGYSGPATSEFPPSCEQSSIEFAKTAQINPCHTDYLNYLLSKLTQLSFKKFTPRRPTGEIAVQSGLGDPNKSLKLEPNFVKFASDFAPIDVCYQDYNLTTNGEIFCVASDVKESFLINRLNIPDHYLGPEPYVTSLRSINSISRKLLEDFTGYDSMFLAGFNAQIYAGFPLKDRFERLPGSAPINNLRLSKDLNEISAIVKMTNLNEWAPSIDQFGQQRPAGGRGSLLNLGIFPKITSNYLHQTLGQDFFNITGTGAFDAINQGAALMASDKNAEGSAKFLLMFWDGMPTCMSGIVNANGADRRCDTYIRLGEQHFSPALTDPWGFHKQFMLLSINSHPYWNNTPRMYYYDKMSILEHSLIFGKALKNRGVKFIPVLMDDFTKPTNQLSIRPHIRNLRMADGTYVKFSDIQKYRKQLNLFVYNNSLAYYDISVQNGATENPDGENIFQFINYGPYSVNPFSFNGSYNSPVDRFLAVQTLISANTGAYPCVPLPQAPADYYLPNGELDRERFPIGGRIEVALENLSPTAQVIKCISDQVRGGIAVYNQPE